MLWQPFEEKYTSYDPTLPVRMHFSEIGPDKSDIYNHFHEELELIFVRRGMLKLVVDEVPYEIAQGESILIQGSAVHYADKHVNSAEIDALIFSRAFLESQGSVFADTQLISAVLGSEALFPVHMKVETDGHLTFKEIIEGLFSAYRMKTHGYGLRIKIGLMQLMLLLADRYSDQVVQTEGHLKESNSQAVIRAQKYMDENMEHSITLEELSQVANYSVYHFARVFKEETGKTPMDYLLDLRLRRAKFLLANTRASVAEVAYSVGFNSPSYFISMFKRSTGNTPGAYRKSRV